jgi:hypothetical protein
MSNWNSAGSGRDARLKAGARYARGKRVEAPDATALLEAVLIPGDRVCLELDSSHVSLVSHPKEIADLILLAAGHKKSQ